MVCYSLRQCISKGDPALSEFGSDASKRILTRTHQSLEVKRGKKERRIDIPFRRYPWWPKRLCIRNASPFFWSQSEHSPWYLSPKPPAKLNNKYFFVIHFPGMHKCFCVTLTDFLPLIKQVTQFLKKVDLFFRSPSLSLWTQKLYQKGCHKKRKLIQANTVDCRKTTKKNARYYSRDYWK